MCDDVCDEEDDDEEDVDVDEVMGNYFGCVVKVLLVFEGVNLFAASAATLSDDVNVMIE